jgi:hypothetical protein
VFKRWQIENARCVAAPVFSFTAALVQHLIWRGRIGIVEWHAVPNSSGPRRVLDELAGSLPIKAVSERSMGSWRQPLFCAQHGPVNPLPFIGIKCARGTACVEQRSR